MPGYPSSPRPAPCLRGQTPSPRPPAFFCLSPPQLCPGPPPSLQNHQQPLPPTGCCPELCHSQRLLSPPRGPGSVLSTEPREAKSLAQGHTAGEEQSQALHPGSVALGPEFPAPASPSPSLPCALTTYSHHALCRSPSCRGLPSPSLLVSCPTPSDLCPSWGHTW